MSYKRLYRYNCTKTRKSSLPNSRYKEVDDRPTTSSERRPHSDGPLHSYNRHLSAGTAVAAAAAAAAGRPADGTLPPCSDEDDDDGSSDMGTVPVQSDCIRAVERLRCLMTTAAAAGSLEGERSAAGSRRSRRHRTDHRRRRHRLPVAD